MITLEPIGYVRSTRRDPSDDDWDRETASIELVSGLPSAAFDGITDFSHAEVIYHFHLAPEAAVAIDPKTRTAPRKRFNFKPTPGLEPGTPSLRVKCSTS